MQGVILLVEPEPELLWVIKENLLRQLQHEFTTYSTDCDLEALEKLKQLKHCNTSVTLFVVKQQSSQITGTEFLQMVMTTFPTAKGLLLNLYDDGDIPARMPLLQTLKI